MRESKDELTVACVLLAVVLFAAMLFLVYPRVRRPIIPNICPIDGQAAEWYKPHGPRDCEYGHFSTVEKKTHTWLGACP
jgi:hypothetical protein